MFGALLYSILAVTSTTLPRLTWLAGASVPELLRWLAAQLPTALAQTMPIAMVLAVLLTFGRMEGDKELLALRAGGVALGRIVAPMLLLGAVAAGGTLAVYQWVTPRTHAWVAGEYWRLTAGGTGLFRLAGQALPLGGFSLTFDDAGRGGSVMRNVRIERWEGDRLTLVRAAEARFQGTEIVLTGHRTQVLDLSALDDPGDAPDATLRDLVRVDARPSDPDATMRVSLGVSEEEL